MKASIDWYFLRRPLIVFALTLIISVVLVFTGMQYEKKKQEAFQQGEKNLGTTYRLYTNMVKDIDLLEQYTVEYDKYKDSGVVGGERRLSWIESLESTNKVLKLPRVVYRLESQEGFVRPGLKPGSGVLVNSSPMYVGMSLLHEEDVFAFIEGLELSISNLFSVDYCRFTLSGNVGKTFDTKKANINADCLIRWISVDGK